MAIFGVNHDKLIDSLFALPQARALREGEFSIRLNDGESTGLMISLSIHAPERPILPTTEEHAPQETPTVRSFQTTSYFLRECHTTLFANNEGKERQLIISGASFEQDSHWLDILVAVKLKHASFGGVEADLGDLFTHLADLDEGCGLLLTGIFHSHLWRGRGAVQPSATDRALQDSLEQSGYKTVQGNFSEDAYVGFFTNTTPFALNILGTGYEEVETHEHQRVVRLKNPSHVSHQTLQTSQQARGQRLSSPNADPRV